MIAQHGGQAWSGVSQGALGALKTAIEFPMDDNTRSKKNKQTQYYHAKDNAIAALGKILKYQDSAETLQLVPFWFNLLPLTHDMDEAKEQNDFLANTLLKNPKFILGESYERFEQFIKILGEVCTNKSKQCEPETVEKYSVIIAEMSQDATLGGQLNQLMQNNLNDEQRSKVQEVLGKCNEEVRAKVMASLK